MAKEDFRNRANIQELLQSNISRAGADFHSDELNETLFLNDLKSGFKLTSKESGKSVDSLVKGIIKSSTVKVRGRFNCKEIKQSRFLKELFNKFEIEKI